MQGMSATLRRSLTVAMALLGLVLIAVGLIYESQGSLVYPGAFALVGALLVESPSSRRRPPA
jgi:hypothetical protein